MYKAIKKILKPIVIFCLGSTVGYFRNNILNNSVTIFCYHDITNEPSDFSRENNLDVSTEVFNYQIAYIKNNFNIIEPSQLLCKNIPSNAALITFDDGFKSFFTNAIPILENHKVPSLIFLNMGPIKGDIFWAGLIVYLCSRRSDFTDYLEFELGHSKIDSTLFLSCSKLLVENYLNNTNEDLHQTIIEYVGMFANENDLDKCRKNPYVFFGNHNYNHYVSSLMSDDEFLKEVEKNTKILKTYPNYLDYFAFPFGQPERTFTEIQVKMLLDTGIKKVFSSSSSLLNTDPFSSFLDRIVLTSDVNSTYKINYSVMRPWFLQIRNNLFKINSYQNIIK
jgi:peptidoglycan/xylan/chitin deacetylase (PgdA/CDA1 family)